MGINKAGHNHATGILCSWLAIASDQITGCANLQNPAMGNRQSATCNGRLTGIVEP
ncbi:hypothetical protein [Trichlorobacter thiogenes]|uniref:hypothetical protein n=1 Tax=Trichlorobacter thiogenes TaxID=115783 RepID=UPI001FC9C1FB|nr:hypothetical protein [Trichlorobacter thiogenes]